MTDAEAANMLDTLAVVFRAELADKEIDVWRWLLRPFDVHLAEAATERILLTHTNFMPLPGQFRDAYEAEKRASQPPSSPLELPPARGVSSEKVAAYLAEARSHLRKEAS